MAAKRKQEKRTKVRVCLSLCSGGNVTVGAVHSGSEANDYFDGAPKDKNYVIKFTLPTPPDQGRPSTVINLGDLG